MPAYIIKLEGQYLLWSTSVDAPISYGMTKEELIKYYGVTYGTAGLSMLDERLKRADEKGVSAMHYASVDELIQHNRAGPDESCLTKQEIIETYIQLGKKQ